MSVQLTKKEHDRRLKALDRTKTEREPNGSITKAAKILGLRPSAVSRWCLNNGVVVGNVPAFSKDACIAAVREMTIAMERVPTRVEFMAGSTKSAFRTHWSNYDEFLSAAGIDKEADEVARKEQRYKDRIKELEFKVIHTIRKLNAAEDLRGALFNLTTQDLSPPDFRIGISRKGGVDVPSVPFLLVSDEQAGEVIKANQIDGLNEYNSQIYRERHRKVFSIATEISKHHMRVIEPGIVVGWLGDAISGSIHAELRESNDVKDVPAVKMVVEERTAAIEALLGHYRSVYGVVLPGNHGRLTQKPQYKSYADTNLETVIGWWLQDKFRNEKRVKIVVPPSGEYFMPLWGWNTFFTHGDQIGTGGGQGFIGPGAPIIRGSKKVYEQQAKMGRTLHFINFGHYHYRLETPYGFCNGCLAGFSEYAHRLRFTPAAAEQWLYYLHPEKGATARWPIYLTDQPKGFSAEDAVEWFKEAA